MRRFIIGTIVLIGTLLLAYFMEGGNPLDLILPFSPHHRRLHAHLRRACGLELQGLGTGLEGCLRRRRQS